MGDQKTLSTCRDSGILKKTVVFLQKKTVVMVALEQIFTPAVCQPSKFWKKWIEGGGGGGGVFENWGTYKFKESEGFGKKFFFWILVVVVLAVVTQTTSLRKPGEDRGP